MGGSGELRGGKSSGKMKLWMRAGCVNDHRADGPGVFHGRYQQGEAIVEIQCLFRTLNHTARLEAFVSHAVCDKNP